MSDENDPLTVIVPVYNEEENFPRLIEQIDEYLAQPLRILVVYDFDEDTTLPVAHEAAKTRPHLSLVKNTLGRGPANALRAGFEEAASGPALVVMADLSDDLRDVARMLELYRDGCRIVCASRYMRGGKQMGGPLLKRTLSRWGCISLHYLAGLPTHDATNNFRLYDAELVNQMTIEAETGFEIALELTAKAYVRGERIGEVPTVWKDRTAGESRFQLFSSLPKYLKWYRYAVLGRRRAAKNRRQKTV